MEKFSVLMSVYYREKGEYLHTALESIFDQIAKPDEVVLVKDGPLNAELDAVITDFESKYNTLKVVALPKNVGLGNALNEGLKHCSYELVARMDSDDISLNDRFSLQLNAFEKHPETSIVGGWISEFEDDPTQITTYRKLPELHEQLLSFFRSKSPLNHVTVMLKKSAVIAAGEYQHFYLLEDYWLWARMIKNGAILYNVQNVLVNVRGGTAMAARRGGWKYAKSEVNLQQKMYSMGLIGSGTFCKNVIIRFTIRIMPNKLRSIVYSKLLRK